MLRHREREREREKGRRKKIFFFLPQEVLPGFEPGLLDSKSKVITNYTIGPRQQCAVSVWGEEGRIEKKKSFSTYDSRVVPHLSTRQAQ